jgi:hypothetical protein
MRIHQFDKNEKYPRSIPAERNPIKPAGDGEGEVELERWLNAAPESLLNEPVLLFSRQPNLPTGEPDLLGLDRFGNVLVFELKRGRSGSESASEASIVSQPQLYAQALDRYDYHDLDALYTEYRGREEVLPDPVAPHDSLQLAFNSFFDRDIDPWELNQAQRLVIVAETITGQTRQSARWLRDQGLDIQCVEVQRFQFPSNEIGFGVTTVVDYDETRTQGTDSSKPGDRVFANNVFTAAFPEVRDLLSVDSIDSVLGNLSTNYPYLETQADKHPDNVRYALRVNPYDDQEIKVAIDAPGDGNKAAPEYLREQKDVFENRGFSVSQRSSMRIVVDTWEIDGIEDLRDDAFVHRVVTRYTELIELGHEVFESFNPDDSE